MNIDIILNFDHQFLFTIMIDMKRIEGEEISGLNQQEMDFLDDLLHDFDDDTLINQFSALPTTSMDRSLIQESTQPDITTEQVQEIENVEENAKCKSTSQQMLYYRLQ